MAGRGIDQGRAAALVLAAALVVGAIVLIVKIAGASHFDTRAAADAFGFTLVLTIFGPCAAAGLHLAERRPRLAWLGYLTAAVALFGFATIVVRVVEGVLYLGGDLELQAVATAATLASAQISLVAAYDRDDDPLPVRLVSAGTVVAILVLGGASIYDVFASRSPSDKLFGIVATLYLLGVALLLLLHGSEWIRRRRTAGAVGG
jgi:hypothetical protein